MSDYFLDYVRTNSRFQYHTNKQNQVGNNENQPTTLAYPSDDAVGGTPKSETKNTELSDAEVNSIKEELAEILMDFIEALSNIFNKNNNKTESVSEYNNSEVNKKPETKAYPSDDAVGGMPPSFGSTNNSEVNKKPETKAYPSDDAVGGMPPSFGSTNNSNIATLAYPSDDAIGRMPPQ